MVQYKRATTSVRAGFLACVCGPDIDAPYEKQRPLSLPLLASGFACAILAQVMVMGILPMIGQHYSPSPSLVMLPFAIFFVGAATASIPASFLLGVFGRRAGFALGASLGCAGGLVLAWGLTKNQFFAIVLGAFWLGVSNGFGLFYRHAAAGLAANQRRSGLALLFGAGAIAGLLAPSLTQFAEGFSQQTYVGTALLTALAHVGALALSFGLPTKQTSVIIISDTPYPFSAMVLPTLIGAAAWFAMTALMGASPIAMDHHGIESTKITSAISWHVLSMYAPALFIAFLPERVGSTTVLLGGIGTLVLAIFIFAFADNTFLFSLSLIFLGVGWSLATLATTLLLHEPGIPPRWVLGIHDTTLFIASILGAFSAGVIGH